MKHLLLVVLIIGIGILTHAQSEYEISTDGNSKMLKGTVKRDVLENDTAFKWFHKNQAGYTPNTETVSVLRAKGSQASFLVLGGTWCEDTQTLLPRFYLLMDAAGIGSDQVRFVAVDRQKHALNHLPEDMHLAHTPTFIVLKGGKEVGRVVEYGKNGQWEAEIGDIVSKNF
ncbi:thioredoxin family protein [Puia sp.]|jgi:thiol-disulfide isomerase/thioredoxin|uniref:thioredoxin family protein n=1 Tax=Puia sp. TaxID=2045100 RepID=UPI002F4155F3